MDLLDFMAQNCLLSFHFTSDGTVAIERALMDSDVIVCDLNLPEKMDLKFVKSSRKI
jgi:CheY-like chemotaxis protein